MSKHKDHVPVRTCVACRSKKAKKELVRLVLDNENRVVVDEYQKKEGRGIYICNEASCRKKFLKNKGLNRFFRTDKAVTAGFSDTGKQLKL